MNLDVHYETDSVSFNFIRRSHRVRDRARKVRPMDCDYCRSAPIVKSGGTGASDHTREVNSVVGSKHVNDKQLEALAGYRIASKGEVTVTHGEKQQ